ncbi:MAG: AI-2E family transporter [Gammaproteobacteria bacterium]|nr:AI-2E family transporter [Gammaproteobacteria bacterium]
MTDDPTTAAQNRPRALTMLMAMASFVIVVAGMRAAESILVPFLVSVFVAVICWPPLVWLERKGTPFLLAMALVLAAMAAAGLAITAVVGSSIQAFSRDLPEFKAQLAGQAGELIAWAQRQGIPIDDKQILSQLDPGAVAQLIGNVFDGFGGVLGNAFLIFWTVVFILYEAHSFPAKIRAILSLPQDVLDRFESISENINRYLAIKSVISLGTAAGIALWCVYCGLKYPILWGMLAFLLNFVPNIGSFIAAIPAVLFALVQLGPVGAGWVAGGFVVVNVMFGNVIEPRFMGRGLGLSTLVVFLSLVFWGWALGPVGMFLSVPLTMAVRIALDSAPETRWLAVLLGPETGHYAPIMTTGRALQTATEAPPGAPPQARARGNADEI